MATAKRARSVPANAKHCNAAPDARLARRRARELREGKHDTERRGTAQGSKGLGKRKEEEQMGGTEGKDSEGVKRRTEKKRVKRRNQREEKERERGSEKEKGGKEEERKDREGQSEEEESSEGKEARR